MASGDGNVGIGFAVPSNTVKTVAAQLLANGKVERAFLGVAARPIDARARAHASTCRPSDGVLVETVTPSSGAAKAGLQAGDEDVVVEGESYRLGGDLIVVGRRRAGLDHRRPARRGHGAQARSDA